MSTIEEFTHWGIDVRIVHDEDAGNPYDNMEQASRIVGFHELHREGWSEEEYPTTEDRELPVLARWLSLFGGEAVAIPFTFHDYGSSGYRARLTTVDNDRAAGFVCVSRETMAKEWPDGGTIDGEKLTPVQMAERCARAEFETWAAWLEGDVVGFVVDRGGPDEDSCWGFYGPDRENEEVMQEARAVAEWAAFDRWQRDERRRLFLLDPTADPRRYSWETFKQACAGHGTEAHDWELCPLCLRQAVEDGVLEDARGPVGSVSA